MKKKNYAKIKSILNLLKVNYEQVWNETAEEHSDVV